MTKLFLLLCLLATIVGIIWTVRVGGADGSWLAIVIPALLAAIVMLVNISRGQKPDSDNAAGH